MVLFSVLLFIVGLLIILLSAKWLVEGGSSIAKEFRISPIVIGLTIVAFGTSAPELVVSVTSALNGSTDIALGNVIGSNIANILLVLGASSLFAPLVVGKNTIWKEIPFSLMGAVVVIILGFQSFLDKTPHLFSLGNSESIGSITRSNGLILLFFFIIFIYYTFGISKTESSDEPEIKKIKPIYSLLMIIIGIVGLGLGSKFFVDGAVNIAFKMGISERVIGLTIVAVGTSLPELITSIIAAYKKQVELAVGNVVGSNIFNIFLILGTTAVIKPIPLFSQNLFDIVVLLLSTIVLFVLLFILKKRTITRVEGIIMITFYAFYMAMLLKF